MTPGLVQADDESASAPTRVVRQDTLLARLWEREPGRLPLMEDCAGLIDQQVKIGRGIKAATLRASYRAVLRVQPGIIGYVLGKLLPYYLHALETLFEESLVRADVTGEDPISAFRQTLEDSTEQVADALLVVTDERMPSARLAIRMAYKPVREEARQPACDAVPALAELLERHLRRAETA